MLSKCSLSLCSFIFCLGPFSFFSPFLPSSFLTSFPPLLSPRGSRVERYSSKEGLHFNGSRLSWGRTLYRHVYDHHFLLQSQNTVTYRTLNLQIRWSNFNTIEIKTVFSLKKKVNEDYKWIVSVSYSLKGLHSSCKLCHICFLIKTSFLVDSVFLSSISGSEFTFSLKFSGLIVSLYVNSWKVFILS